jgi:pimeloyl-ACP methyl ester carboxylesterase
MPPPDESGLAPVNGIRMYYAVFNRAGGDPVVLLHNGLGNADQWAHQIPVLSRRRKVIVADSRGHGRSSRTSEPFSYRLMASDVLTLLTHLGIDKAAIVGTSDGGILALEIAITRPERVSRLWADGANSSPAGLEDPRGVPIFKAAGERAIRDYARLSPTPGDFALFRAEILALWSREPNYGDADLAGIGVPTAIVAGEHDELIKREHTEAMARLILSARLIILPEVSHFACLQDPAGYSAALAQFLDSTS